MSVNATSQASLCPACATAEYFFDKLPETRGCYNNLQLNAASQTSYVKQLELYILTLAASLRLRLPTRRDLTRTAPGITVRSEKLPLTYWGFAWKRDFFRDLLRSDYSCSERVGRARSNALTTNSDQSKIKDCEREATKACCYIHSGTTRLACNCLMGCTFYDSQLLLK